MSAEQRQNQLHQLCQYGRVGFDDTNGEQKHFSDYLSMLGIGHHKVNNDVLLESALELIDPQVLRRECDVLLDADSFEWQYRLVTGSTNADVLSYFDSYQQPTIACAETQTGGRGRRGNQWYSPFARNIYCTVGIKKNIVPASLGLLSIVTGLALCNALVGSGLADVKLKWPNDLFYNGRKLGGILIESRPLPGGEYFLAIGFGINVIMNEAELADINQAATSVQLINPQALSRQQILGAAIVNVVQSIASFGESSVAALIEAFNANDAFYNQPVSVTTTVNGGTSETIQGLNQGIAASGQLQVDTDRGRLLFSAADISLRNIN